MIYKDTLNSVIGKGCCRSNFRFPCYLLPSGDSSGWTMPPRASSSPMSIAWLSSVDYLFGFLQRHVDVGADVVFAQQMAESVVLQHVIHLLLHA